jgi:multiple sugar transport system substrate-binding protein
MFSKKMTALIVVLAALAGLSAVYAGGKRSTGVQQGRIEVVLWHNYADHHSQALDKIIANFNASQDRVTVVAQGQPISDFYQKIMQAVRNGTGPV